MKKKPGPDRWREAVKLYVMFNLSSTEGMSAAEEIYYTIKQNAEERKAQKNKFGASGTADENLRYQTNMPAGLKIFLNMVDPNFDNKENLPLRRKVFPEFVIAEKY